MAEPFPTESFLCVNTKRLAPVPQIKKKKKKTIVYRNCSNAGTISKSNSLFSKLYVQNIWRETTRKDTGVLNVSNVSFFFFFFFLEI